MVFDARIEDDKVDSDVPGIVYLSTIPNGMNVSMISDIMQQFGKIGRVYLVPKKKKVGKYRQYEEGWVEFLNKKIAKRVAKRLNCTEVLGSKVSQHFASAIIIIIIFSSLTICTCFIIPKLYFESKFFKFGCT
ncbi:unnamed protein product [Schistosoma rodhaini]|nr:unnamed protein product [Schistosoma rodhaini]